MPYIVGLYYMKKRGIDYGKNWQGLIRWQWLNRGMVYIISQFINDGFDYQPGDKVIASGNKQLQVIDEITPEEAVRKFDKNITAEV